MSFDTTSRINILLRLLFSLAMTGAICGTFVIESRSQVAPETTMKRTEWVEAAAVLKALTQDWALVDSAAEVDFLIFVSESRDELKFYPKKSFIRMMERSGLIENPDSESSSERKPLTFYESDGTVWKEVTEASPIVFQYRVTPKGRKFLLDVPRLTGKPIRRLRIAASPVDIQTKPLKVVTYDRLAINKRVDAFEQKAIRLIEAAFSPKNDIDRAPSSRNMILCGAQLWRMVEPAAMRNGLKPVGSRSLETHSFGANTSKSEQVKLPDQPISGGDEAVFFWKTLREHFKIDQSMTIRRGTSAELLAYPYQYEIEENDFPSPHLALFTMLFIVEGNKSRFMVLVKNTPQEDMEHSDPQLRWVEVVP